MTSERQILNEERIEVTLSEAQIEEHTSLPTKYHFWKEIATSVICGLLWVMLAFPEVTFLGATFRSNDVTYFNILDTSIAVNILPMSPNVQTWHAYYDRGASTAQSEPGMEFIRESVQKGESPYWNPYSAGGTVGPETLVDNKFAIINWIYAIFGGGQRVFDLLILSSVWLAASCIHYLLRSICKLPQMSAWVGAAFYVLNGFSVANIGSNITGSYYFIPACLLACCKLLERFSLQRFAMSAITIAAVLSFTFLPTTVTGLFVVIAVCLYYLMAQEKNRKQIVKDLFALSSAGVIGFCLVAAIYLPIAENLLFDSAELASYANRPEAIIVHPNWLSLLSLFSSSHFFESYEAFNDPVYAAYHGLYNARGTFHIGVVAAFLFSFAIIAKYKSKSHRTLVWGSLSIMLLFLARIYNLPGYSWLISKIPVLGRFQASYLWTGVMLPCTLLVAFGLRNLNFQKSSLLPLAIVSAVVISLCLVVYHVGTLSPQWEFHKLQKDHLVIMFLFMLFTSLLIIIIRSAKTAEAKNIMGWFLALALLINLVSEFKFVFFPAPDFFKAASPEVQFVNENANLHRAVGFGGQAHVRPEIGAAWGLYDIGSTNMSVMPAYDDFYRANINLSINQRFSVFLTTTGVHDTPELNTINPFALDVLGVKYLVLPYQYANYIKHWESLGFIEVAQFPYPAAITPAKIFENPNVWPRAFWLPAESLSAESENTLVPELRDTLKEANITEYHHTNLRIQGVAERDGIVVLTDNWHRNWKAEINGEKAEIVKVHGTFRGVAVPAGDFVITMHYRPSTLNFALVLTGLGLLLCCLGLFVPRQAWAKIFQKMQRPKFA